jgi:hypothetical protein
MSTTTVTATPSTAPAATHARCPRRRALAAGLVALATLAGGWPSAAQAAPAGPAAPAALAAVDPGAPGADAVDVLEYDLGDEAFVPEGFPGAVELRGRVYAPEVIADRAPLVLLMHGRHVSCADEDDHQELVWPCPAGLPEVPSYQGYDALGELLASHGMVVASIGVNGVNGNDGFVEDGGADARAQTVLETLRRFQAWDASATGSPFGSRFVGHLDLTDVGLMGHSRGGEGVVAAAQLNQRIGSPFGIRAVLALAPVDFDRRILGAVPLGVVLPYCDGDVSDLQGAYYYDDARHASPGDPAPKSTYLLYGANHNFFNTVWTSGPGSFDDAGFFGPENAATPDACGTGGLGRLAAADQEQAGATLMAGFLRRHLLDDDALQPFVTGVADFPASSGAARWATAFHAPTRLDVESWSSPSTYRRNRFGQFASVAGPTLGIVCNPGSGGGGFDSAPSRAARTSFVCPSRDGLAVVNDTGTLDVGWARSSATVRQPLAPAGTDVTAYDGIRFRVAVPPDVRNDAAHRQDLSVVLEDADGNRSSVAAAERTNAFRRITPGSRVRHAVLNGVRIPLAEFSGVDLTRIRAVELRFDRTPGGRLELSDLAFTAEGTGSAVGPQSGAPIATLGSPSCRRTPAARWACALVGLAWGRGPTSDELKFLSAAYGSASGRASAAASIAKGEPATEARYQQFGQLYSQSDQLGGVLDGLSGEGRRSWEVGIPQLTNLLAYAAPSVTGNRAVVGSVYESLLGRAPTASERAYWEPRVGDRGPAQLATALVKGTVYRGRVVDARYRQVLARSADSGGRAYWVAKLATPGGEQALLASLLGTEAFRVAVTA